jgi:hypothetical protein
VAYNDGLSLWYRYRQVKETDTIKITLNNLSVKGTHAQRVHGLVRRQPGKTVIQYGNTVGWGARGPVDAQKCIHSRASRKEFPEKVTRCSWSQRVIRC